MNYIEKVRQSLKDKNRQFVGSVLLGTYLLFRISSLVLSHIYGKHMKLVVISFIGSLIIGYAIIAKWGKTDIQFWKYSLLMILAGLFVLLAKTGLR